MRRVGMRLGAECHLESREEKENAEKNRHPGDLHQHRTECDEEGAEDKGAKNAVEKDPVPVFRRDGEEVEDHQEDEEVVDREALLDEPSREKLKAALARQGMSVKTCKPRIRGKEFYSVKIKPRAEEQCETDPEKNIGECLAVSDRMLLAIPSLHVEEEAPKDHQAENSVEPPVLLDGKEFGMMKMGSGHGIWGSVDQGRILNRENWKTGRVLSADYAIERHQ